MRSKFCLVIGLLGSLAFTMPAAAAGETSASPDDGARIVLYASPTSRRRLAADGLSLKAQVNQWRDLLRERGARYEIVTDPDRLARFAAPGTLILASAVALDDREREAIGARLRLGDNLLATGALAIPDLCAVFPAPPGGSCAPPAVPAGTATANYVVTVGGTPLTYALPAGTRIWLGDKALAALPAVSGSPDAYATDWSRSASRVAMVHAVAGASRRALLGWPENAWSSQPAQSLAVARMALDWVMNRPVAYVAPWPWPYRAAMSFGVDATWRFENMAGVAAMLSQRKVAATFNFLAPDLASQVALAKRLAAGGNGIGTLGDRWQPFGGEPAELQAARATKAKQVLTAALGTGHGAGMRPPEGRTDAGTEAAASGLEYLVDAGRVDALVPTLTRGDGPVVLPNPLNLDGHSAAPSIAQALAGEAQRLARFGGYGYVGLDAAQAGRGSALIDGISHFLDDPAARGGLWIADAAAVARWSRSLARVSVDVGTARDAAFDVTLRVAPGNPLPQGVALVVHPPGNARITTVEGNARLAEGGANALLIGGLPAGEHRLRLHFAP